MDFYGAKRLTLWYDSFSEAEDVSLFLHRRGYAVTEVEHDPLGSDTYTFDVWEEA